MTSVLAFTGYDNEQVFNIVLLSLNVYAETVQKIQKIPSRNNNAFNE